MKPTPPTRPKRTSCSQLAGLRMPWSRRMCGRVAHGRGIFTHRRKGSGHDSGPRSLAFRA